jgi:hypothetical protein
MNGLKDGAPERVPFSFGISPGFIILHKVTHLCSVRSHNCRDVPSGFSSLFSKERAGGLVLFLVR